MIMSVIRGAPRHGARALRCITANVFTKLACARPARRRAYVTLMLTATVILIVFNALKIGNVDFVVTRPTLAQYEAIYAVS